MIFFMAYDIHGPWDSYSDFNAPLYKPEEPSHSIKTASTTASKRI